MDLEFVPFIIGDYKSYNPDKVSNYDFLLILDYLIHSLDTLKSDLDLLKSVVSNN